MPSTTHEDGRGKITFRRLFIAIVLIAIPIACAKRFINRYQARGQVFQLGGGFGSDGMWGITRIGFTGSDVMDDDLGVLADFAGLRELRLNDTLVTDDCVETLPQLPKLQFVDLRDTQVSSSAVQTLSKRFPDCTIASASTPLSELERNRFSKYSSCPGCRSKFGSGYDDICPSCGADSSGLRHPRVQ